MKQIALLVLALASPNSAALGVEFKIGDKGAIYCPDDDTLAASVAASLTNDRQSFPPSCGIIPPGTTGDLQQLTRADNIVKGVLAVSSINNGKPVSFITVEEPAGSTAQPAGSTAPNSPAAANRSYKLVSPIDVRATPSKWIGRDIEFSEVNAYWVEDDDVRFVTGEAVTVFAKNVSGDPADLAYLKENCETSKEAASSKCRVNIRFSYASYDEDNPSGLRKRTTLTTRDLMIIRRTKSENRKKR